MRVKGKRVLKNGTIAGYVYYPKEKKWKWRFLGKQQVGGKTGKELLTEYLNLTSEIQRFVDYLYKRTRRGMPTPSSIQPRIKLKEEFNKIKGNYNKQSALIHTEKQIRRNGIISKGSYLDVTYDRINVLLSYIELLNEYNKIKKKKQFKNHGTFLKPRKFYGTPLNDNTSTFLIQEIKKYICNYLEDTRKKWETLRKQISRLSLSREDLKKYEFVSNIKNNCMKKKFSVLEAKVNATTKTANILLNAAEENLGKATESLQRQINTTTEASNVNIFSNANAEGALKELGISTRNTGSTGNGNAGPQYINEQTQRLLINTEASGNPGTTNQNLENTIGKQKANAVRIINRKHKKETQTLKEKLNNAQVKANTNFQIFQEAANRLNPNQ